MEKDIQEMIAVVTCQCGSVDSLVRNFLHSVGYGDWLSIPIKRGRDQSLSVVNRLPQGVEKDILREFLRTAGKWAIIIGYDDSSCKWSDIAHNGPKSRIEAEFVVKTYA